MKALPRGRPESVNVGDAKRRFSDLLGRVAYGGETVLITRRGRPMARLVPADARDGGTHLGWVQGWLEDDDPYLEIVDEIVKTRPRHASRVLRPKRGLQPTWAREGKSREK